ncbi:MAG: DUF2206 domain-containing protein [Patescibacteria group bacterium]
MGKITTPSLEISIGDVLKYASAWMAFTTLAVIFPNTSPWIATPLVIGMIGALGLLIALVLRIRVEDIASYVLYSFGLGLSFVMLGGLLFNWLLPHVGTQQPLGEIPLILFFDISALCLGAGAYVLHKGGVILRRSESGISWVNLFFAIVPVPFIFLSVLGALTLNNFGSGTITLVMLFGIALYCFVLVLMDRKISSVVHIFALYSAGVALLLMYSLRSSHIFGWDINQEYQVFQMTLQHLMWKMSYYPDLDYNACLSITLLPTIIKELTNIPSEYVFKVTFQLLFAITPVMVYVLARRYVSAQLAFLASFLVLSQTWFFEQMPALIRQEIAFIFYLLLLLVIFDTNISKRIQYILLVVFTAALIVSHYSTAYIWLVLMGGMLLVTYGIKLFSKGPRPTDFAISPYLIIGTLAILFIWEIPITHTANALLNFAAGDGSISLVAPERVAPSYSDGNSEGSSTPAKEKTESIFGIVQNAITIALFVHDDQNTLQNLGRAREQASANYGEQAGYQVFADAEHSGYAPSMIATDVWLAPILPPVLTSTVNLFLQVNKILLVVIFPLIGLLVMCLAVRRGTGNKTYDFVLLNVGAYMLVVGMVFIPYAQRHYNLTRLYLQMFLTLSVLSVIGGAYITKHVSRHGIALLAAMVVIGFCFSTGATGELTGGLRRVTLYPPPGTLDAYYLYDTEVAVAEWLAANRERNDPVQSDSAAALRLQSFAGMDVSNTEIFPETIERNSYVYLGYINVVQGYAFSRFRNNLLIYTYPLEFVDTHKDLIYSNGVSKIYR